ncbi:MAG: zf-TFIIB domain-containing protein [Pyrinomonadaceae bacterium]
MNVETLNCPMCGAATSSDAPHCQYCGSRLATISCSSCFGLMFRGSKFCQRCGAAAGVRELDSSASRKCPRCRIEMQSITIGATALRECERCLGLWLDLLSFEKLCADREQQSAVLGAASPAPQNPVGAASKVSYVPCPECSKLMNRINFARCSGVVVDVCKGHGTWFDRDELSRIVEFIHAGGLEASRTREKLAIEEERQRLWQERSELDRRRSSLLRDADDEQRLSGIASARELLKLLLD